jgi:hypothetical protein
MKQNIEIPQADKLWSYIVEHGKKIEADGITNKFDNADILTIVATMDFFQATDTWKLQTTYDLKIPRYRLFDWLAMCVMSRNDDDREQNNTALQVLVYAWLQADGHPDKFIDNLRVHDYQIETEWEKVVIP